MKNVKLTSHKSGFSLAEMLVIIAIIGVIAAIAIPNLGKKATDEIPVKQIGATATDQVGPQLPNDQVTPAVIAEHFVLGYAQAKEHKIIVGHHKSLADMLAAMHNNIEASKPYIHRILYGVLKAGTLDDSLLQKNGVSIDATGMPIMKVASKTTALPVPAANPAS